MVNLIYNRDNGDWYDLSYALQYNDVTGPSQIKRGLSCIEGCNDEEDWHWLVELEDNTIAYLRGGCDYTGWDCQSSVSLIGHYKDLEETFTTGLPLNDPNSTLKIRDEFFTNLEVPIFEGKYKTFIDALKELE